MTKRRLSQAKLKYLLNYDPDTGLFRWNEKTGARKNPAGSNIGDGYMGMSIGGVSYRLGRLAFLYMTGRWPMPEVDHINRIRHDNRFCNLRECTRAENLKNRVLPKK